MPLTRDELNRKLHTYCKAEGLDFQKQLLTGERYCHLYGKGDELSCPFLDKAFNLGGEVVYRCKRDG